MANDLFDVQSNFIFDVEQNFILLKSFTSVFSEEIDFNFFVVISPSFGGGATVAS